MEIVVEPPDHDLRDTDQKIVTVKRVEEMMYSHEG